MFNAKGNDMVDNRKLDELNWTELEQSIEHFIAADGPNTDELPSDDFFALWARFEQKREERVIEVQGEFVGEQVVLSLASSNIGKIDIRGPEIFLPDGTRIILRLQPRQAMAA